MKTYIINLQRSVGRREHILSEVAKFDLDFELVTAIDGSKLTEEEKEVLCDMNEVRKYPDWLSPGMLGASLSHHEVYKRIIEGNVDMALVLEDDVILPNNFLSILQDIQQTIATSEIVSLYYFSFQPCRLSKHDAVTISDGLTLRYPMDVSQPISAAGYVITRAAAETLAAMVLPVRVGPDSWGYFYDNGGFESFRCVYPVPLTLTAAKSEIHGQSVRARITKFIDEHEVPILDSVLRGLRKRAIGRLSKIELVNEVSPVAKSGNQN